MSASSAKEATEENDATRGSCRTKLKILKEKVIENSQADSWNDAKKEWRITDYRKAPEEDLHECECTYQGITHLYTITNVETASVLFPIGSKCIKHFGMGSIASDAKAFQSQDKVMQAGEYKGQPYKEIPREYVDDIRSARENYPKASYQRLADWADRMDNVIAIREAIERGEVPPKFELIAPILYMPMQVMSLVLTERILLLSERH